MSTTTDKKETRKLKSMRFDQGFLRALKTHARAEGKSMSRILEDAFWKYLPGLAESEDTARAKRRAAAKRGQSFNIAESQMTGLAV